jgi:hypothetical protein
MATFRNQAQSLYNIGSKPPFIEWTVVKGDTAAFQVYVTDDSKLPLNIPDWTIDMEIKRPTSTPGVITDNATIILTLAPVQESEDGDGEFTVSLTAQQSSLLRTGDIFDIELSDAVRVWTVGQGKIIVLEDVTN